MTTDHSVPARTSGQQPVTTHITAQKQEPHHSTLPRAALRYAERGIPVFPLRPGTKEPFGGTSGHLDATTDRGRIDRWWTKYPNANVGIRTGPASGIISLDLDVYKTVAWSPEDVERELGELPRTWTVRTGSGGLQYYYRHPDGPPLKGIPENMLGPGVCVKADRGYVVAPPSVTVGAYEVVDRSPMADAPPWLLEKLRDRSPNGGGTGRRDKPRATVGDGERIPEGSRNDVLTSNCGRLHDGTRDLNRLTEDLMAINEERCDPPWPRWEVEKVVRSIYAKPPCKPRSEEDPELAEVLKKASDHFYETLLPGGGKSKKRDVFRACLIAASKKREIIILEIDGETRRGAVFSDSYRQLVEEANMGIGSVCRNIRALCADGVLFQVEEAVGERSATWALLEPAQRWNTPVNSSSSYREREVGGGVPLVRAHDLETPMYAWRDPIGNAGGGVEVALEAFGPRTTEELADMLGISRPRDLERRHLRRLEKLGVVEERNGRWARPADHRKNAARLRNEPYATVTRRKVRRRTNEGRTLNGRVGTDVEEIVVFASPAERARWRREKHAEDRIKFRDRRRRSGSEGDDACRELLNAWDDERDGLIPEVNWPEVVDGVIVHHDECGCSWCELDLPRPLLLASGVA